MDLGHATRFATRLAVDAAGDLYPGPVLMPRGVLRALDPLLALALGPARREDEALHAALERSFRGRPDGPLLLALWASMAAGEIPHAAVRRLLEVQAAGLPDRPADEAAWAAAVTPGVEALVRCALPLVQPKGEAEAVLDAALHLGRGLILVHQLVHLPEALRHGCLPLPRTSLEAAGVEEAELREALPTPAVRRLLVLETTRARSELAAGASLRRALGARLRRGLRAALLRADILLRQLENPRRDPFRRPPALSPRQRWTCALRALWSRRLPGGPSPGEAPSDGRHA